MKYNKALEELKTVASCWLLEDINWVVGGWGYMLS